MKKKISIILALFMVVFCAACGKDKNIPVPTASSDAPGTYFLYSPSDNVGSLGIGINDFHQTSEYGIHTQSVTHTYTELEGKKKSLDGVEYVYSESNCDLKNSNTTEYGTFYSQFDIYYSADQQSALHYLHGTDILTLYYDFSNIQEGQNGMTDEQAIKIAEEAIRTYSGKDALDRYEFYSISRDQFVVKQGGCRVVFRHYVHGYMTDDSVAISIDATGKVYMYGANEAGKYKYTESVTKDQLSSAADALREKLADSTATEIRCDDSNLLLTTDTSGKLYLRASITFMHNSMTVGEYVYVNVN